VTKSKPTPKLGTFAEANAEILSASKHLRAAQARLSELLLEVREAASAEFDARRSLESILKDSVLSSFESSFTETKQATLRLLCEHYGTSGR
jgi:predicted  nucleic acid-binding Zn-ribbon protein